ncbi:unnamed protein product [Mytilus coruscus]|uniref:Ig-like domain-containing protein n=1 Tax=Mytilus coruscus TaxID=42192 RepID=A0A6J8C1M0_MYTCO|nr:unnamed protein product [Mytilus coruscus]
MCSEYKFSIRYLSQKNSEITTQKFWMTNNTFTADINQTVALSWTTSLADFFNVRQPVKSEIIYKVQGGSIIRNSKHVNYIFDNKTQDVKAIKITVINVNKIDAGLYSAEDETSGNVDGCCLLIVTTKPKKPTLTLSAEHPFVGDTITFTCHSTVQRWPAGYRTSNLTYKFLGNTRGVSNNNRLTIHALTKLEKGNDISCQATDDLHKVSIESDAVTLDPYYGPDNVVLKPGHMALNVTEGTILGPINCTATCYPKCLFKWRLNRTRTFEDFLSSETLVVANIKKNQTGIYRCLVVHPSNTTLLRKTDISVNVQYSPKIKELWLSDKNVTYGSTSPAIYSVSEGNHLTIKLRIKSNPDPQIVIHSSLLKFPTLLYTKLSDDFTTKLPSLKCENSGNFTIQASNGIAYGDNRTVNLEIKCKCS